MLQISHRIKRIPPLGWFALFTVVAATIAGIAYGVASLRVTSQQAMTDTEWSLVARSVTASDHTIGPVTAPVQVIVYSSISCPFCRTFFTTQVPKLQAAFGDRVVIAYRHNPIPVLPNAGAQEEAAECAYRVGGNDAFWRFVNALFPSAGEAGAADTAYLAGIASQVGIAKGDFLACMAAGQGKARVQEDKQEAVIGGLTTDPSFLIKSAHRALVIKRDYYSQIYASIQYLLDTEGQSDSASQ